MVQVARSLPSQLPISWQEGNALQMPFPDEYFDVVLCQQGVQFFPDRAAGLREMGRVAAPGGRVVLAVWGPIEQSPGFAALAAALGRHVSADAAAAARSPFSLWSIGELRGLLEGTGWRDVEIHSQERMLHFPSPAEFVPQYVWGSPVAAVIGKPDTAMLEAVIGDVADALQPYLDDHGLWFPIENHLAAAARLSPAVHG
jgi:SAM-dependent methyltransferase